MSITVDKLIAAFKLLYRSLQRADFSKSLGLKHWKEHDLQPLVRTFLLGKFGRSISIEPKAKLPGSPTGNGRLDFKVGQVAVEFATRPPTANKQAVSRCVNTAEVKKLMKHDGLALLVLFDFSNTPFKEETLEKRFRKLPSLGKGPHRKSSFNVAYYYKAKKRPIKLAVMRKNIRVS